MWELLRMCPRGLRAAPSPGTMSKEDVAALEVEDITERCDACSCVVGSALSVVVVVGETWLDQETIHFVITRNEHVGRREKVQGRCPAGLLALPECRVPCC